MAATPSGLKAIETKFRGYRFRSRLEARWAVFLESLDIEWLYETEGFELPDGWYLPDFYLPQLKIWLEIKSGPPSEKERKLADQLAASRQEEVIILAGNVGLEEYNGISFAYVAQFAAQGRNPVGIDYGYQWCECAKCHAIGIQYDGAANRNCDCVTIGGDAGHDIPWPKDTLGRRVRSASSPRIMAAYEAARSARFEHGESPDIPE